VLEKGEVRFRVTNQDKTLALDRYVGHMNMSKPGDCNSHVFLSSRGDFLFGLTNAYMEACQQHTVENDEQENGPICLPEPVSPPPGQ